MKSSTKSHSLALTLCSVAAVLSCATADKTERLTVNGPMDGRIIASSNFRRPIATTEDGKVARALMAEEVAQERALELQGMYPDCAGAQDDIGDAFCDAKNNNADCGWDGGDCCVETCVFEGEVTPYLCPSEYFNCKDPETVGGAAAGRSRCEHLWISDGYCDEKNNNADCNWDGGDCCASSCLPGQYNCNEAEDEFTFDCLDPASAENSNMERSVGGGGDGPQGRATGGEKQKWLRGHNTRRRDFHEQHGVSFVPLEWSNELEDDAQAYAKVLAKDPCGDYHHDPKTPQGENLAVSWAGDDIDNVMYKWVEDEYLRPNEKYKSGHGHMTQALWRPSKYVGCATSYRVGPMGNGKYDEKCYIYVCRYLTPGNCERNADTWLDDTLRDKSRCKPDCPPTAGCYHELDRL
jgi:hypothetical protein